MPPFTLKTNRLILRQWQDSDLIDFAAMNANPDVMAHFPALLTAEESNALAEKCRELITKHGWGIWATQLKATEEFIGFIGLHAPKANLPFSPCIEIAWRLSPQYWGHGYATEGANACLQFAFEQLNLTEVVAFTTTTNKSSQAVMERIGMINTGKNFMHPDIPRNHPLSEHVLYSIMKQEWNQQTST